jgi:hypothetical protein
LSSGDDLNFEGAIRQIDLAINEIKRAEIKRASIDGGKRPSSMAESSKKPGLVSGLLFEFGSVFTG